MKTVLVLEDDPSNMRGFSALLSLIGYSVLEATTGKEGIETGNRERSIDLFLSDVDVPGPSGTEVALELIKAHPCFPRAFRHPPGLSRHRSPDLFRAVWLHRLRAPAARARLP